MNPLLLCCFLLYVATTELSTQLSTELPTELSTELSTEQSAKEDSATGDNSCFTNSMVFTNYAKFHQQSLVQKHKGNFLIFMCTGQCGGYGNRIHGITMSLLFAILSNRTFLIQISHPFDINRLLHPNAVKWNYTGYRNMKNMIKKDFNLRNFGPLKKKWPSFPKELFNPDVNIITLYNNLGFSYYFQVFDDKWNKLLRDHFNITKENNILTYGCVVRYLFTYDKIVTDAIKKEMQELGLIPGLYVSVHFRSFWDAPGSNPIPGPLLSRVVEVANNMSKNSNKTFKVYFVTDSQEAKEMANTKYSGQILTSHIKEVHVDKDRISIFEGFIGVIVNIEVAAMGAVFVRTVFTKSANSTFSDMIESIGLVNKNSVIKVKYNHY